MADTTATAPAGTTPTTPAEGGFAYYTADDVIVRAESIYDLPQIWEGRVKGEWAPDTSRLVDLLTEGRRIPQAKAVELGADPNAPVTITGPAQGAQAEAPPAEDAEDAEDAEAPEAAAQ